MTRKTCIDTAVLAAACWFTTEVTAQHYPGKAVTIIVVAAPGSSPDVIARAIGHKINEAWRQPVVIENRTGAGAIAAKRSKLVPELPTLAETGLSGYEVTQWYVLQAPAGTPSEIRRQLSEEVRKILSMPDIVERLSTQGAEPAPSTPEFLETHVKSEIAKWSKVVKASGAKVD